MTDGKGKTRVTLCDNFLHPWEYYAFVFSQFIHYAQNCTEIKGKKILLLETLRKLRTSKFSRTSPPPQPLLPFTFHFSVTKFTVYENIGTRGKGQLCENVIFPELEMNY